MSNLTTLAKEVSKCRSTGISGRKVYPKELKKRICREAKKHGKSYVATKVGIAQSLISRWISSLQLNDREGQQKFTKTTPRNIQLEELVLPHSSKILTEKKCSIIRLTSPSGIKLEVELSSLENLSDIVYAFAKGTQ